MRPSFLGVVLWDIPVRGVAGVMGTRHVSGALFGVVLWDIPGSSRDRQEALHESKTSFEVADMSFHPSSYAKNWTIRAGSWSR